MNEYIYIYDQYHKRYEEVVCDSLENLLNRIAFEIDENLSCPIEIRDANRELVMNETTLRDRAEQINSKWYDYKNGMIIKK